MVLISANGYHSCIYCVFSRYLDWVEDKFIPGYNSVEVLTNGDNVKLIVYFRHRVNLRNHTYFECLKEKRKLRSGFVLHAEDLVDQYKNREQRNSGLYDYIYT